MRLLATALIVGSGATTGSAHHSFSAFDVSAEKTVTGTVKQFDWTNPHTWIWIEVAIPEGRIVTFGFEGLSPNYLTRRGWTKTTVKPGDQIRVTYRPLRDGSRGGMFIVGKLATGEIVSMSERSITE